MKTKRPLWAEEIFLQVRALGVGMEEMRDDIKILAEGQSDMNRNITEIKATLEDHTEMIGNLAMDMTLVKKDVAVLKEDVSVLKSDMKEVKQELSLKADTEDILPLQDRVRALEKNRK